MVSQGNIDRHNKTVVKKWKEAAMMKAMLGWATVHASAKKAGLEITDWDLEAATIEVRFANGKSMWLSYERVATLLAEKETT